MARQKPKLMSREEVERLLKQPNPRWISGLRNRAMLETMYRAGLRVSEVVNLRPQDVRLAEGWLEIMHSKRDGSRNVPIGPRLRVWLEKWDKRRPQGDWFFCTTEEGRAGQQLDRQAVWQFVRRYARKAGIEDERCSPHKLRHCFITERFEDQFLPQEVQALAGHATLSTTMYYMHVRDGSLAEKMSAVG